MIKNDFWMVEKKSKLPKSTGFLAKKAVKVFPNFPIFPQEFESQYSPKFPIMGNIGDPPYLEYVCVSSMAKRIPNWLIVGY